MHALSIKFLSYFTLVIVLILASFSMYMTVNNVHCILITIILRLRTVENKVKKNGKINTVEFIRTLHFIKKAASIL
jgi:hypothetical protein